MKNKARVSHYTILTIKYIVCITLAILRILPFWIMFVNATRSTPETQQRAISDTLIKSSIQL